ncbi:hypothetical protein FJT64_001358 [Amphibalanus amphitrite]|uniref:DUF4789 domain-containing protein n=1 Tax=Amphibalanus amphitrite TaxID=1232801 RepID=A0A6A4VC17_AMPAM|nr:hypothetical protein FJT64_001358 [Amphibalanus amphitrite]
MSAARRAAASPLPQLLLAAQLVCGAAAAYVAHQAVYVPTRYGAPPPALGPAPHGYLAVVGPFGWSAPTQVRHQVHHHSTVVHGAPPRPLQSTGHSAPHSAAKTPTDAPLPPPSTNDSYSAYVLPNGNGYSYAKEAGSGDISGSSKGGDSSEIPKLQLDYGVPVTGFLEAQLSSSSGTSINWSMGMTPANRSLPLIPDDIPVLGEHPRAGGVGPVTLPTTAPTVVACGALCPRRRPSLSPSVATVSGHVDTGRSVQELDQKPSVASAVPEGDDLPDDGCARDEVRLRSTNRWYIASEPCQPILQQGCCPEGQWVVVNKYTRMGECAPRLCPSGFAFVERDGLCHDLQEEGLCPDNRRVYVTAFGEPRCGCADGEYVDTAGECRPLYSTVGCPYRQQLRFNAAFKLECQPAVCPKERPVPFQGWCKNFGDSCGTDYRFVLGFDTTRLEAKCYPSEELDIGGRHSAHTPTTTAPAPTVPALQDTYLPPPGQGRVQYARRTGAARGRWLWQRRRRQQRPGLRRRRPPPQQFAPWSRLDVDQVTFVDSERVSAEQLAKFERSGQAGRRRRRFRRQIFAEVPLLNTCKPGARSGPNFKCRDKALPGSGSRSARSPVPPANAPKCPADQTDQSQLTPLPYFLQGQRLDALGRCRQTVGGLGK